MAHLDILLLLLLLLHLVRELEAALGPHVAHAGLQWVEITARAKLLPGGNHAHIDILLMGSLELLLLLLEELDLLLDSKLVHLRVREHAHQRGKLRRATPMGDMKPATSRAMHPACLRGRLLLLVLRLLLFLLHGEQGGVGDARQVRSSVAGSAKTGVSVGIRKAKNRDYGTLRRSEAKMSSIVMVRMHGSQDRMSAGLVLLNLVLLCVGGERANHE
jgi:hypothetical protein